MAAARAVFETYELLERILLHLPVCDILLAERVSKQSKSLIARSLKIGQVLFRRPCSGVQQVSDYVLRYNEDNGGWGREINWDKRGHTPVFNPLLNRLLSHPQGSCASIRHYRFIDPKDKPGETTSLDAFKKLMCSEASWRSMLMTQPPITEMALYNGEMYQCWRKNTWRSDPIQSEVGLRFGHLWKELIHHWHVCPEHPIDMDDNEYWPFQGDDDIRMVDTGITGWDLLARFDKDCAT